jgi:hypothetical protein
MFFEVMGVAIESVNELTFTLALINSPEISHFEKLGQQKNYSRNIFTPRFSIKGSKILRF